MRFLCSAYLGEHKGIPVLLEAIKQLSQDTSITTPWQVTIAGEGHLRPLIETALQSEMAKHLRFVGRVPRSELLALMSETDVAVLASIWPENEPVTMLEAIALGKAQIATRLGGNLELMQEPESGFLVAPGDAQELAQAMRQYILKPELAAEHGAFNYARRDNYDESKTITRLEQLYAGPRSQSAPSQPVVICGTGWPAVEVSALAAQAHKHLERCATPRFIWREWADAAVWRDARLLWLWDRHPEESLVNTAIRRGVPVLAPAHGWSEGLSRHYGGVILYRTYLEALAAMRALLSVPSLREKFAGRSHAAVVVGHRDGSGPELQIELRSKIVTDPFRLCVDCELRYVTSACCPVLEWTGYWCCWRASWQTLATMWDSSACDATGRCSCLYRPT